ncbi:MAG: endolytic transglycosylase MltG [Spongiibacteraceae bacterium]
MFRWLRRFATVFFVFIVLALAASHYYLQRYLDQPLAVVGSGIEYTLVEGGSLGSLAYGLERQGVLETPRLLLLYSRLTQRGQNIQAGDYWLTPGTTPRDLLDKLERGDVRYFNVTLVEGWNLQNVMTALRSQSRLNHKIKDINDPALLAMLGVPENYTSLEGLLFPDTYRFHSQTTDLELLRQAVLRMQQVLAEEWQSRADNLPYETAYEALIMASLIEKETGDASERAQIAGVFVRRLQRNMRLQTDPAVIYGMGSDFDGNLRRADLKNTNNPYNTYRFHGLTHTPIALAGREAIHAALHPAEGDSLYFVAKGDGSHYFSATLQEHLQAVNKYQIQQRRKDYSSAPKKKPSS